MPSEPAVAAQPAVVVSPEPETFLSSSNSSNATAVLEPETEPAVMEDEEIYSGHRGLQHCLDRRALVVTMASTFGSVSMSEQRTPEAVAKAEEAEAAAEALAAALALQIVAGSPERCVDPTPDCATGYTAGDATTPSITCPAACAFTQAVPASDETCTDTVEGEAVADCATGYTAGDVMSPSTTCPTGCTQVDATNPSCIGTAIDTAATCSAAASEAACSGEPGCVLNAATSETCTDTIEGEAVAICDRLVGIVRYIPGDATTPSTTCPSGCNQVDAVAASGETCVDAVVDCVAGYTAGDAAAPSTTCPTGCTLVEAVAAVVLSVDPEPEPAPEPEQEEVWVRGVIDCDCICDGDGAVDAVQTGRAGCFAHDAKFSPVSGQYISGPEEPYCAVPMRCQEHLKHGETFTVNVSTRFPGTAYRYCNITRELLVARQCATPATARWGTLFNRLPDYGAVLNASGGGVGSSMDEDTVELLDRLLPAWESWEATPNDGSGKAPRKTAAARVHALAGDGTCGGPGECERASVPPTAGLDRTPPPELQHLEVYTQRLTVRSALGNVQVRLVERDVREEATLRQLPPPPPPPPPPGPNATEIAMAIEAAALAEEQAAIAYLDRLMRG